jgi:hypothetical protein
MIMTVSTALMVLNVLFGAMSPVVELVAEDFRLPFRALRRDDLGDWIGKIPLQTHVGDLSKHENDRWTSQGQRFLLFHGNGVGDKRSVRAMYFECDGKTVPLTGEQGKLILGHSGLGPKDQPVRRILQPKRDASGHINDVEVLGTHYQLLGLAQPDAKAQACDIYFSPQTGTKHREIGRFISYTAAEVGSFCIFILTLIVTFFVLFSAALRTRGDTGLAAADAPPGPGNAGAAAETGQI